MKTNIIKLQANFNLNLQQRMKDVKRLHNQHLVEKEGLNEQFNFIYGKYKEKKAEIVRLKE